MSESWEESPILKCVQPRNSIRVNLCRCRLIYDTVVKHAAPVAIIPQSVLSHAGFSHAPEKVSTLIALLLPLAQTADVRVLQTIIDLARLLACGLVRHPQSPPTLLRLSALT